MKNATLILIAGLFLAACASTEANTTESAETPTTKQLADSGMTYEEASTEVCRHVKELGSNLRRKVCHNKITWQAIETAEAEATEAMRGRVGGMGNSTVESGGGLGG